MDVELKMGVCKRSFWLVRREYLILEHFGLDEVKLRSLPWPLNAERWKESSIEKYQIDVGKEPGPHLTNEGNTETFKWSEFYFGFFLE